MPTPRMELGQKTKTPQLECQPLPACAPRPRQDHSLEPRDNSCSPCGQWCPRSLCLLTEELAWLGRQPDVSTPGKSLWFCSCGFALLLCKEREPQWSPHPWRLPRRLASPGPVSLLGTSPTNWLEGSTDPPGSVTKLRGFGSNPGEFESRPCSV